MGGYGKNVAEGRVNKILAELAGERPELAAGFSRLLGKRFVIEQLDAEMSRTAASCRALVSKTEMRRGEGSTYTESLSQG